MRRSRANPLALPRKRQTRKRADEYYPCLLALVISILCPVAACFVFLFLFLFLPSFLVSFLFLFGGLQV